MNEMNEKILDVTMYLNMCYIIKYCDLSWKLNDMNKLYRCMQLHPWSIINELLYEIDKTPKRAKMKRKEIWEM